MAEELDDNRFKGEVMRMLGNLINKANEHDGRFDTIETRLDQVTVKLDDVIGKVVSHEGRLRNIEDEGPAASKLN